MTPLRESHGKHKQYRTSNAAIILPDFYDLLWQEQDPA